MTTFSMTEVCHAVMRDGITCYIEHTGGGILTLFAGAKTADGLWTVAAGPGHYISSIVTEGEMDALMLAQVTAREAVGNTESFSVGQGGTSFTRTEDLWTCPELATVAEIADEIIHQVREHAVQTPVVTPVKTWPETPEEQITFVAWQYEVNNGDTLRGFRDWLAAEEERKS